MSDNNNQLFLYTWRLHDGCIENNCIRDNVLYSAIASTKEQAIEYILERLKQCKVYETTPKPHKWGWSAEDMEASCEYQKQMVPNTLMVRGSFCDSFHTVLESDGCSESDETPLRNFLQRTVPTKHQICQGFVVLMNYSV